MMSLFTMGMLIMIISVAVMMLASLLSKKTVTDREKSSPFECGFDPSSSSRLPFSLRFFLIAIIFLIFDVEIALILPTIMIINTSHITSWTLTTAIFILILIAGLFHEWNQGALTWTT